MAATLTESKSPSPSPSPLKPQLGEWVSLLIDPHPTIKGIERRQARWLIALLGIIVVIGIPIALLPPLVTPGTPFNFGTLAAVIALGGLYLLSRTRFFRLSMILTVGMINIGIYAAVLANPNPAAVASLNYLLVAIVLSAMVLTTRQTIFVIAANLIIVAALPVLVPTITETGRIAAVLVAASTFLLLFVRYRDMLEEDRRFAIADALEQTRVANEMLRSANDELVKANALAKETVRLKSEFMSTMSHELRTPLNAILGFCGIMLEGMGGTFDNDARGMLERISSNSQRLLSLINEVLDLARIEAGRLELTSQPLVPAQLAESWRLQTAILAERKGVAFLLDIDPALPPTIYGDPDRLSQIGINLLSNAFKFTETGSVKLEFRKQDEQWVIQVTDTGIGIPPHAINYIFDEFRQVDGSSKRVYGGSGLGLAIVRNLVRMMNGSVKAASELGKGSVFTVTLPLMVEAEPVAKSA